MNTDTPITEKAKFLDGESGENTWVVTADFARQLERELNEARTTLNEHRQQYANKELEIIQLRAEAERLKAGWDNGTAIANEWEIQSNKLQAEVERLSQSEKNVLYVLGECSKELDEWRECAERLAENLENSSSNSTQSGKEKYEALAAYERLKETK